MSEMERTTPAVAIRRKCIDCCGGSMKEVRLCMILDCPLWLFRLGQRPETVIKRGERSHFLDPHEVREMAIADLEASGIEREAAEKMVPQPSVTYEDVCRIVGR